MRTRLVTALLCVSLAATGCSDDDPSAGPTLPPITEAPTVSANPTAEPVPSEATEATPQGAAEFVRHLYATIAEGYGARDPAPLRAISAEACEACANFIATIEGLRRDDASVPSTYGVEVLSVEAPALAPGQSTLTAIAVVNVPEFSITAADGTVTLSEPAQRNVVQNVTLERVDDSWRVVEMTQA